ncbi:MAG: magnesium transporter [Candidatus Roizmanbacteria bacterium]|nr:magnesium transporter [Candidatus Roizmanbacteria bacterium]
MNRSLLSSIKRAAAKRDTKTISSLLEKEGFHSIADGINLLRSDRLVVFTSLDDEKQAKVAIALNYRSKRNILPKLSDKTIESFLQLSDEDDAADILQFVSDERKKAILEKLQDEKRKRIETLVKFHPETAGGLMDMNYIVVKPDFNLQDVAEKIDRHTKREKKTPLIVVTKDDGAITGYVPYRNLILTPQDSLVKDITRSLPLISAQTKKRKLLHLLSRRKLEVIGVTDTRDQLLGIIHVSDLAQLIESETTDNLLQFAGVSREEDMLDPASVAVKNRYMWLIINLATAFLAAFVVSRFEETIAQMAILASFMPIVAGMGGNAGTQSLAVVIRGIALGELAWTSGRRIILKEVSAGFINGIITAAVTIPVVWLFTKDIGISLVLGSALIINLIVAGFFGAMIPLTLKFFKIDPAVASTVFVTTATDVFGFLAFLGLATVVLL